MEPADGVDGERRIELLDRVRFPGVADAGRDDLPGAAERPPVDALACAGFGAALARTLSEVHRAGVAHGGLRSEAVLVDEAGRPLLSGFEAATEEDPSARQRDVHQLAVLLAGMLADLPDTEDAGERRRRRRLARVLQPRRLGDAVDLSTTLADLAAAFDEAPPTRARAVRIRLGLPAGVAPLPRRLPRPRTALLALIAVAGLLFAVGVGRGDRPSLADDGPIVEFEGRRYQVGRAGDVAVVGDWPGPAGTCDGSATLVLLRPGTGELFAFDGWAETGELLATRLETHRGAIGLGVDSGHCDTLLLVDAEGGRTPIATG
ncbi:MAG: hypothetical protein QF575_01720 [Acidimicrobiales bacterium]|nr:hypothetical protein [Acidimicrobiales bacterium]